MRAPKSRIVLLTGNSLCHNPRALKDASALARAGYEVFVLGNWIDPAFRARDIRLLERASFEFIPVLDFAAPGLSRGVARFAERAGRRIAHAVYGLTGRQSPRQLGFGAERLLAEALRLHADLYIAHSELGLYVASRLLHMGMRVGVDMEDWFSEDLLPEVRRYRPLQLLRALERQVLGRGAYASAPSRAMSAALAKEYQCAAPAVLYNAFDWTGRQALDGAQKDRGNRNIPSVHWFSTTLGPGRGVEDLVAAIPLLQSDAEIHLRGNSVLGFEQWLGARVPDRWRERIFFHSLVMNDELLSRIAEHDIGFAGETKDCRSRDLTVTNKILHYLLGGLAVVASDTAGQREVASQAPEAVRLFPSGNVRMLADALNSLLSSPERLRLAKTAALGAAQRTFCWERQEGTLLDAVARALSQPMAVS